MINEKHAPDPDDDDIEGYLKIDRYNEALISNLSAHYKEVLNLIGENPAREGLLKTPERISKAMLYLTQGYELDAKSILTSAMFKEDYSQMVLVKDIEVYSMCEHHMLPFFGKAHVAYIPNGHVVGLSKIPRIVDVFARRLQVQERLTNEIRDCIQDTLNPMPPPLYEYARRAETKFSYYNVGIYRWVFIRKNTYRVFEFDIGKVELVFLINFIIFMFP